LILFDCPVLWRDPQDGTWVENDVAKVREEQRAQIAQGGRS